MAVNLAFITDIASEFATVDSARVDRLVVLWGSTVGVDQWGDQRDLALGYLICHVLKLDTLKGKGAVTSEKIGDLQRNYASSAAGSRGQDSYDLTSYGRTYKELRAMLLAGPLVT